METIIREDLTEIKELLRSNILNNKEVFNIEELVLYTGFSKNYVYKLTSTNLIPYYSPNGKKIFFKKSEIDEWLLSNRNSTYNELEAEALSYAKIRK